MRLFSFSADIDVMARNAPVPLIQFWRCPLRKMRQREQVQLFRRRKSSIGMSKRFGPPPTLPTGWSACQIAHARAADQLSKISQGIQAVHAAAANVSVMARPTPTFTAVTTATRTSSVRSFGSPIPNSHPFPDLPVIFRGVPFSQGKSSLPRPRYLAVGPSGTALRKTHVFRDLVSGAGQGRVIAGSLS